MVSRDHAFLPHVRSSIERIKNTFKDRDIKIATVRMDEIAAARLDYQNTTFEGGKTESEMQRAATDLFKKAVSNQASDIHIRVNNKSRTQILFRVHNDLHMMEEHPAGWGQALCSTIYHSMADVADATFDEMSRQDARIGNKAVLPEGLDGIRIATAPQVDGYIMVMRLLYDASGASDDICDLGYTAQQKTMVQYLKKRPTGITLISGPTGSGKSTTLQRTLKSLIRETQSRKHVITVEDPPEYPIPGAVQTPVSNTHSEEDRSRAFQDAIKGAMRADPDVIMIGEVRDPPSAKLAFQAAMTGHQVWTTVHANGAFHVIARMLDLGSSLENVTDPSILSGMICQRLLKTLCPSCKKPFNQISEKFKTEHLTFNEDVRRFSGLVDLNDAYVLGDGCPKCKQSGFSGRTVVAEVVVSDRKIMSYIRSGNIPDAIAYWKAEQGGMSMIDHAILKIKQGVVDPFVTEDELGPLDEGKSLFAEIDLRKKKHNGL